MRDLPVWNEKMLLVAVTNVQPINSEIKEPSIEDEIDIFLSPEQWVETTINGLYGHTFLGWSWNIILVLLMVFFSITIYFFKKTNLALSLLLGFVVAWGLMDVRTIYNHYVNVDQIEDNQFMNKIKRLKTNSETFAEKIGTKKWTQKGLAWPHNTVVAYTLAEHQYVPYHKNAKVDFLIIQVRNKLFLVPTK